MGNLCNKKLDKTEKTLKIQELELPPPPQTAVINQPQIPIEIPDDLHISSAKSPPISSINWNSNLFNQKAMNKHSRESLGPNGENNNSSQMPKKLILRDFNKELYFTGKDNVIPDQTSKSKSALRIVSLLSENESISRYKKEKKKISSIFQPPKILDFSFESEDIKICSLLAQRSNINHHHFPLWDQKIHENLVFYQQMSSFVDFSFNREKTPNVQKWFRIRDFEGCELCKSGSFDEHNIRQGAFENCSLIACLISIISVNKRLLEDVIFPQIEKKAIINKTGKYGVKLQFNGAERLVEIDDFLPYDEKNGFMTSLSFENRDFACSILEKAVVKFYGDDFSKIQSNAAIETFHLIGWIPEILNLTQIPNKINLWTRLYQNYKEGNFLINLGTQEKFFIKAGTEFLQPGHTYSLLEMLEIPETEQKLMRLRNPWGKPVDSNNNNLPNLPESSKKTGVFFMEWTEILKYFSSIYLSWNPYIYPFRKIFHSKWFKGEQSLFFNERYSVEYNPQFLLRIPPHFEDFEIRIMLERHIIETNPSKFKNTIGFILFPYEGERTLYPKDPLKKSMYSAREIFSDVLIFEVSENEDLFVLAVLKGNCDDPEFSHCEIETHFSLKFFSFLDVEIFEMPFRVIKGCKKINIQHKLSLVGSLSSPFFPNNPQWDLVVSKEIDVRIQAKGSEKTNMMLMVMSCDGKKDVREFDFQAVLQNLNAGFSSQGVSHLESHLKPGIYRLILAVKGETCEETDKFEYFEVIVNELAEELSDIAQIDVKNGLSALEIKECPKDNLEFKKKIQGEWDLTNSKGISRVKTEQYQGFLKNPGYILKISSDTLVSCSLRSLDYEVLYSKHMKENQCSEEEFDFEPPSLSFCLLEIQKDLHFASIIEDSLYVPTAWGTYLPATKLKASEYGYLLLCLNYVKGYEGSYELVIESDHEIKISNSDELLNLKGYKEIEGAWKKNNAVGCCSELLFYKNPQFELSIESEVLKIIPIYIEIESKNEFPLGMYLLQTEGLRIEDNFQEVKVIDQTKLFLKELNVLASKLKSNFKYTLVVCTHKAGQIGDFKIRIHCDSESKNILIKELPEKNRLQEKKTFYGQWDKVKTSVGFSLKPKCEMETRIHLFNMDHKKCGIFLYAGKERVNLIGKEESCDSLNLGSFLKVVLNSYKTYFVEMRLLEGKNISSVNFYYEIDWNSANENLEIEIL